MAGAVRDVWVSLNRQSILVAGACLVADAGIFLYSAPGAGSLRWVAVLAAIVVARFGGTLAPAREPAGLAELTGREHEVFRLLAQAHSNAEIAQRLHVGEETVKTHVSRILRKLGLRDRVHAVVYAHLHGMVDRLL